MASASGLDLDRALSIFNLSSGRNECTRTFLPAVLAGQHLETGLTVAEFRDALDMVASRAAEMRLPVPLISLSHELWTTRQRELGGEVDGARVLAEVL